MHPSYLRRWEISNLIVWPYRSLFPCPLPYVDWWWIVPISADCYSLQSTWHKLVSIYGYLLSKKMGVCGHLEPNSSHLQDNSQHCIMSRSMQHIIYFYMRNRNELDNRYNIMSNLLIRNMMKFFSRQKTTFMCSSFLVLFSTMQKI